MTYIIALWYELEEQLEEKMQEMDLLRHFSYKTPNPGSSFHSYSADIE